MSVYSPWWGFNERPKIWSSLPADLPPLFTVRTWKASKIYVFSASSASNVFRWRGNSARNATLQLCPAAVRHSSIQIPPTLASRAHILYFGQTVPRINMPSSFAVAQHYLSCWCRVTWDAIPAAPALVWNCRLHCLRCCCTVQCLLCCCTVSPLQISWRDATCPPPPGAGGEIQRFQWIAQRKWIDLSLNWHWAPSSISPPDVDIFLFNPHRQNSM